MRACALCRAALMLIALAWPPAALAQAAAATATATPPAASAGHGPPPSGDEVDYTRDLPPPRRSWERGGPLGDADAASAGTAAAEAAVARQEYQLLRPLLRMVMVLVGIVLLMLLLARGARLLQQRLPGWVSGGQAAAQGPQLHIVDRLALGPKHTLAWVERDDGGAFLVAWGEGGTSLLGPLPQASRPSFAATMAEVTHAPKPAPSPHSAASPDAAGP